MGEKAKKVIALPLLTGRWRRRPEKCTSGDLGIKEKVVPRATLNFLLVCASTLLFLTSIIKADFSPRPV
jgi:hypothetical protein